MKRLYLAVLLWSLNVYCFAQITSQGDGDWNDPGTWDCDCVPDAYSGQEIIVSHLVTIQSNIDLNWVRINSTGQLTINPGVTVAFVDDFVNAH